MLLYFMQKFQQRNQEYSIQILYKNFQHMYNTSIFTKNMSIRQPWVANYLPSHIPFLFSSSQANNNNKLNVKKVIKNINVNKKNQQYILLFQRFNLILVKYQNNAATIKLTTKKPLKIKKQQLLQQLIDQRSLFLGFIFNCIFHIQIKKKTTHKKEIQKGNIKNKYSNLGINIRMQHDLVIQQYLFDGEFLFPVWIKEVNFQNQKILRVKRNVSTNNNTSTQVFQISTKFRHKHRVSRERINTQILQTTNIVYLKNYSN
eukprot:TRINITY_DN1165_c0_g2_i1.p1 TRINITY_DN1165_c0_g2~~TRINITY_DN1165_c0_g2_i1.p1  ORF type:complete len:259 (-),score=-0.96 TRINITY_DN1165_c0_g2_i1:116-892(-)